MRMLELTRKSHQSGLVEQPDPVSVRGGVDDDLLELSKTGVASRGFLLLKVAGIKLISLGGGTGDWWRLRMHTPPKISKKKGRVGVRAEPVGRLALRGEVPESGMTS